MKHISYVILVLFTLYTNPVFSAGTFCVEKQAGTVVVFGNGIMSKGKKDAKKSLGMLEDVLHATLTSQEFAKLQFDLAYNKSYGLLRDLYESAKQKLGSDNVIISFWRWVGNQDMMPDVLQETARQLAVQFDFSTQVGSDDLNNHVALYRTSILEGNKVLVVSHSQGNFFANAAYQKLFEGEGAISDTGSFGIIAVATPASYVAGDGPHTTLVEDSVIAAIALATPRGVLPPLFPNISNIMSGAEESNFWGHSFLEEYMATGSNTVAKIIDDVTTMMYSLVPPIQQAQPGIITATLTWSANQPDVDLHTLEPNGAHVYYGNSVGPSGHLDLDDTDGSGPEHYYVSCDTLETGTYNFGVNYFNGDAPETAFIQISAGSTSRSFSIELPLAVGPFGDDSPIPVADVIVTGTAEAGYGFSIENRVPEVNTVPDVPAVPIGEF